MRISSRLLIGLSVLCLFGCWGGASTDGSSSSSSSVSSIALVVIAEDQASSQPTLYTGPFKKFPDGKQMGAVTVTGYITIEEREDVWCEEQCELFSYVYFNITDGMDAELSAFLGQYPDDSFSRKDAIGIGCALENDAIARHVGDPEEVIARSDVDAESAAALLSSNPRNLVTATFVRDFEPLGTEAPTCYSHFQHVTVTE